MPNKTESFADQTDTNQTNTSPDYERLVRFLIEPFLDDPKSLYINSEIVNDRKKIWLRVAFDNGDRGKVFGRGGRNIQAIRNTLKTAGAVNQEVVFLDVYSDEPEQTDDRGQDRDRRSQSPGNFERKKGPSKPPPRISKKE
jgi:uncharacterized protein